MAGAVDVERGERLKRVKEVVGQPQADSAGGQGVVWDHAAFPEGKAVEEVGLRRVYHCPTLLSSILRSGY
jgi:hypothetical protein